MPAAARSSSERVTVKRKPAAAVKKFPAKKKRILISNDDGIHARGLEALVEAVSSLGEVWVVAPQHEQSATSHSLSLYHPLRIRKDGERRFAVDGTPADNVYVAINHLMKGQLPDLVLSGIDQQP